MVATVEQQSLKVAVYGTGSIGRRHVSSIQSLCAAPEFVFLREGAREDTYSKDLNAHVVPTLDDVMAANPDLFIIATPSALHLDAILASLKACVPVYVEKPVVTARQDVVDIRRVLASAPQSVPSLVGCNLRFLPALQTMKDMVTAGHIGPVVRASFEAGQWLPNWRPDSDHRQGYSANVELGGGVVFDLIHELDSASWLLGPLAAKGAQTAHVPALEIKSEAVMSAVLRAQNGGALATVGVDYVARQPVRRYSLIGTKGTLTWDLSQRTLTLDTDETAKRPIALPDEAFDVAGTYVSAMRNLLACIRDNGVSLNPLDAALDIVDLALDVKEMSCKP